MASELAVYSGVSKDTATWLCGQVLELVGLHFLHYPDQVGGVGQVAVVQERAPVFGMGFW